MTEKKIAEIERLAEAQKKYGSFNVMLGFCLVIATLAVGTIIWQNTRALEYSRQTLDRIANDVARYATDSRTILYKIEAMERKVDVVFFNRFEVIEKGANL